MYSDSRLMVQRLAECPHCGCNDVEILKRPNKTGWMQRAGMARCRYCMTRFTITKMIEPPAITPPPIEHQEPVINGTRREPNVYDESICPKCGGKSRVTSTRKRFRWRQCKECEHPFKTARSE